MANGTIAFDTLQTSGQITGTAKSVDTDFVATGSAKVWMRWDMSASSLADSLNVSGFTDVSTGISQFNYSSSMGNANYTIAGISGEKTGGGNRVLGVNGNSTAPTTALIRFASYNASFAVTDVDLNGANIKGDLA
jgi:hypothetical protein